MQVGRLVYNKHINCNYNRGCIWEINVVSIFIDPCSSRRSIRFAGGSKPILPSIACWSVNIFLFIVRQQILLWRNRLWKCRHIFGWLFPSAVTRLISKLCAPHAYAQKPTPLVCVMQWNLRRAQRGKHNNRKQHLVEDLLRHQSWTTNNSKRAITKGIPINKNTSP